jgi:acetoacetyl-CoA reductase/3-oxoacyl-[acyl-carrier protein] reductase
MAARRFENQVAIVTGGLRGIGRAIAEGLAAEGAEVHVFDRDPAAEPPPGVAAVHALDIADGAAVHQTVTALPRPPSLLVNNAGITRDRSLLKMSEAEWRSVIDVNLTGAFHCLQAAATAMCAAGYGRIVNITSINGLRGKFGQANYTAAKGGLIALTKTAAREFGRKGVTVNAVAPGMVLTEMTLALDQEFRDKALAEAQLTLLPDAEDIAAAVLFLLSDQARTITGQVLQVDSGQYL